VRWSVRTVQRALVRAGYDVGRTGVDNRWGPNTRGALERFLRRINHSGEPPFEVYEATQMINFESAVWSRLSSAAPGSGGETQSRSSSSGGGTRTTSETDPSSVTSQLDEEGTNPWFKSPWLWGGVALVLTGTLAFYATAEPEEDDDEELELLPAF